MTFTKCWIAVSLALLLGATSAQAAKISLQGQSGSPPGVVTWDVVYDPEGAPGLAALQQNIAIVTTADPNAPNVSDVSGTDSGTPDWGPCSGFSITTDLGNEMLYGGICFSGQIATGTVTLGTFSVNWDNTGRVYIINQSSEFLDESATHLENTTGHILAELGAAAAQTKDQAKCINKMSKEASKLLKAWDKDANACIKNYGKGKSDKLGNPDPNDPAAHHCLTADVKNKVSKSEGKVTTAGDCTPTPDLGFEDPNTVKSACESACVGLLEDLFSTGAQPPAPPEPFVIDPALADPDDPKDDAKCQTTVHKEAGKLLDTKMKVFVGCKKAAMKAALPSNLQSLQEPVMDCIRDDEKGKISKGRKKFADKVTGKCGESDWSTLFPNKCKDVADLAAAADCVDQLIECRFCQALESLDGMLLNCDLFDDGQMNGTCQ
jgi:hypothetical protein